jgi:hypothetical protein
MWFLWVIGGAGVLYLYTGSREPFAFIMTAVPIIWFGGKALLSHTKNKISTSLSEKRNEKEWRKNLARRAEEERVLGFARNESMIQLMREQADNLIKQQNAGMHVERELMAMREKMLSFENAEFEDLIGKINKHL